MANSVKQNPVMGQSFIEDFLSFPPTRPLIANFQVRNLALDFDVNSPFAQ